MLGRKALEAAHAREVEALKQTIVMLADQVDYLRGQLAGGSHTPTISGTPPFMPTPANVGFLSEAEEDLEHLRANELISAADFAKELENLGFHSASVESYTGDNVIPFPQS